MHRALRYGISLLVGVAVTALVAELSTSDRMVILSLPVLYGTVMSMFLAHWQQWTDISPSGSQSRSTVVRNVAVGGNVAFTGSYLLQVAIPAAVAAFGLALLGVAAASAEFSEHLT